MHYIMAALIGYLAGNFNLAYIIARLHNKNIKHVGNGNAGASNVALNFNIGLGISVAMTDAAKTMIAYIITVKTFPNMPELGFLAATFAVIGHMFPFYMKFKGGKGFASYIGLTACIDLKFALVLLICALIMAFVTNYIIIATFTFISALPCYTIIGLNNMTLAVLTGCISIIIALKHVENLRKIHENTEPKLREALKRK